MRLDWQTDGAVWQWNGKQNARDGQTGKRQELRQELWQAGSQALIPLVGNNSRFILFPYQSKYLYITMAVENQPFHLPIYSYSYLLFIYNNPDGLF